MVQIKIKSLKSKKNQLFKGVLFLCVLALVIPSPMITSIFILFISMGVIGIKKLDKKISFIEKVERNNMNIDRINELRDICMKKVTFIEYLFQSNGFSVNPYENYIVDELYKILNYHCNTLKSYKYFLSELDDRTLYVLNYINEHNVKKHYEYNNTKKASNSNSHKSKEKSTIELCLQILELDKDVRDMEVIKKAYRKLVKIYHPDVNKSVHSETKFRFINEAYEKLQKLLIQQAG